MRLIGQRNTKYKKEINLIQELIQIFKEIKGMATEIQNTQKIKFNN